MISFCRLKRAIDMYANLEATENWFNDHLGGKFIDQGKPMIEW